MINWRGTKLFDRICWAKENLKPVRTDYVVVYEDIEMDCAAVMYPDPHCMAMLMHGNLMPPVEAWHRQRKGEKGLLHSLEPMPPLTEGQAVEFLIMKDVPERIWRDYNEGNRPKMKICKRQQLPSHRRWRNAWRLAA